MILSYVMARLGTGGNATRRQTTINAHQREVPNTSQFTSTRGRRPNV